MEESTVRQWTSSDVQAWLLSLNIPCNAPLLQAADGRFLYQLHSLRAEAPEFFYQCLRKDLGLEDLQDLLNFADALKGLPLQGSGLCTPKEQTVTLDQGTSLQAHKTSIRDAASAAVTEEKLASEQESAITSTKEAGSHKASVPDVPVIAKEQTFPPEQGLPSSLPAQQEGAAAESQASAAVSQGLPSLTAAVGATAAPVPKVSSAELAAILKRELAIALERTAQSSPPPPPPPAATSTTRQHGAHCKDESKDKTDTKEEDGGH